MFRRRFRPTRPIRQAFTPIQRAVHLLSAGQPRQAAVIFAGLAGQMEALQPRRAANLHAQAAHAFAEAQDAPAALEQARAALNRFRQLQMGSRFTQFSANITRKLQNLGMTDAAATLQAEFDSQVEVSLPHPAAKQLGRLPTSCAQCGGPLRPDEADWLDEQTIECAYCGALIRTE